MHPLARVTIWLLAQTIVIGHWQAQVVRFTIWPRGHDSCAPIAFVQSICWHAQVVWFTKKPAAHVRLGGHVQAQVKGLKNERAPVQACTIGQPHPQTG